MLLGFNMLLWSDGITEEHFPLFAKIKRAGFDGIEIPIFGGAPGQVQGDRQGGARQWPARDRRRPSCPTWRTIA